MEYQFGLIQLWIYRMFFIEFFFSFDFIFNFLRLIHLATGFGYEKLFFYYTFWNFSWIRSNRNNNHLLILTFFCGSQEGLLEKVEWFWFLSTDDRGLLLLVVLGFDFYWT